MEDKVARALAKTSAEVGYDKAVDIFVEFMNHKSALEQPIQAPVNGRKPSTRFPWNKHQPDADDLLVYLVTHHNHDYDKVAQQMREYFDRSSPMSDACRRRMKSINKYGKYVEYPQPK